MKKYFQFKPKFYNFRLLLWVFGITALGIAVIGSAAPGEGFQTKQMIGFVGGFVVMAVITLFDYHLFLKLHWFEWLICVGLLLLVLIPHVGKNVNGATRWIALSESISIQPSEFAKILMIIFWAWLYGEHTRNVEKWRYFFLTVIFTVIPLLLIVKEPDLSTTVLMVVLFITAIFIAGFSYKKFLIILAVVVPIVVGSLIYIIQTPDTDLKVGNATVIHAYQKARILSFIYPADYDDLRYQQDNAVLAIGSGQLYGKGLYNDSADSVKNANYIAEPQTDFIFAIVGEELGFIGSVGIILLLFLIAVECVITGTKSIDMPGRIICFGVAAIVIFQTFINIGVVTEILPNTGIPLPFVSYGLSSLVAMYAGIGLVLNVRIVKKKTLEAVTKNEYRIDRA